MALIIYTFSQNRNSVLQIKERLKIILHLVKFLNLSLRLSLLRDENKGTIGCALTGQILLLFSRFSVLLKECNKF